jgi:hypothetical protein
MMATPARFLCIGTHHKTGTIWMRKVFRQIKDDQGVPFMQCYRAKKLAEAATTGPQIIVNWSSSFPAELMALPHARFLHIIRDPRDVLLSGMRYHLIAPLGNEKFLREKRDDWGGKNYQDHLNTIQGDVARLMFEMENKHAVTLGEMLGWPYGHPNAIDLKYENLIGDTDCALFRSVLTRFAIQGLDIDKAVQAYWDNSLFGGLKKEDNRAERVAAHVTSGAKRQWASQLPREVAEVYADRYGAALVKLGYETDQSWVNDCKPAKDLAA